MSRAPGSSYARDWGSTIAKAPLRRNQFGVTVGGQSLSTYVASAVLPTATERSGNFSQSLNKPIDPLTKQPFSCNGVLYAICPNRFDPVARPFTYQMNFSVQRQVTNSLSVTAAYVGSLGRDLPFLVDRNYPIPTPNATNAAANVLSRRPISILGTVQDLQPIATSSYHSLQLSATHRLSQGLSVTSNYVFSKTLTSAGIQNTTISAENYNDLALEHGRADTDLRHAFLAIVWQLNYYRGNALLKHVLNGWQVSPILKLRSGLPLNREWTGRQPRWKWN